MHFCSNCHRLMVDELQFCPGCGFAQNPSAAATQKQAQATPTQPNPVPNQDTISMPPIPGTASLPSYSNTVERESSRSTTVRARKSPMTSALLNFFLPGVGYIYNGAGADSAQMIFGVMCFVGLFLGIFVPTVLGVLFIGTSSTTTALTPAVSAADYLSVLVLVLPFALAYDGYRRAIKINNESKSPPL